MVAPSGHAAHPDEIVASCQGLQTHIQNVQDDAVAEIKAWQDQMREEELAEKRRVAPGWLDRDEKILQPKRTSILDISKPGEHSMSDENIMDQQDCGQDPQAGNNPASDPAGEQLDRAFGGMGMQSRS